MRIVEIKVGSNGSHRNQRGEFLMIPDGYALIPDGMETPNFPFGEVTAEEINGIMTVTNWVAGEMPIEEEYEEPISETEQLRADVDYIAVMTGVEL